MFAKHHIFYVLIYTLIWELGVKRGLVFFDMITDATVIYELYKASHTFWFTFSVIFFLTPFIASWAVALRIFNKDIIDEYTIDYPKITKLLSILISFPLIGSLFVFLYELYLIIRDILYVLQSILLCKLNSCEIAFENRFGRHAQFKQYDLQLNL